MAVEKMKIQANFVCYLLDYGCMVNVSQINMRPLPAEYIANRPHAFQASLNKYNKYNFNF